MTTRFSAVVILAALALLVAPALADDNKDAGRDRVIQAKDKLAVSVDGLDGPNRVTVLKLVVDEKGQVKLPQVKEPVKAKGLTCRKLEEAVDKAYRDAKLIETANAKVVFRKETDP